MYSRVLFFVFLGGRRGGGGILEPNLLHSFTYSYILLQNGFGFLSGKKIYRMVLFFLWKMQIHANLSIKTWLNLTERVCFFLHFSAIFLHVSWTTQEHLHNDTKWFLFFSWKQPRRLQNGFDFLGNFHTVCIQFDITEVKLGLGLQNGFDFFGFMLDWALQNGFEFYLKKLNNNSTTLWNITKWFLKYFCDWAWALQNGFDLFLKKKR